MDTVQESQSPSPAKLEEQLQIYARELHQLYLEEKKQRQEVAEEKLVLEYRVRELNALNALFQKHLERKREVEEALIELIDKIKELLARPGDPSGPLRKLVGEAEATLSRLLAPSNPPQETKPPQQ